MVRGHRSTRRQVSTRPDFLLYEIKQVSALTVLLHFHGGFLGWIPQIRTVGGIYLHISMIFMILCRHLQTIYDILNICEGMYIYIHMYYNAIYMYIRGSISTACN